MLLATAFQSLALAERRTAVPYADMHNPADATELFAGAAILTRYRYGVGASLHLTGSTPIALRLHVRGRILAGVDRLSDFFAVDPAGEVGLGRPFKAEIHVIAARSHGPVQAGLAAAQIGSFDGGCGGPPDYPNCSRSAGRSILWRKPILIRFFATDPEAASA